MKLAIGCGKADRLMFAPAPGQVYAPSLRVDVRPPVPAEVERASHGPDVGRCTAGILVALGALMFSFGTMGCDGTDGAGEGPTLDGPAPPFSDSAGFFPPSRLQMRAVSGRGDGLPVAVDNVLAEMGAARAVCLGEQHDSWGAHSAQLLFLDRLASYWSREGIAASDIAIGWEMFQHRFQPEMDAFASGQIDETALLSRTDYANRWGWDFAFYRPMAAWGRMFGLAQRALNANKETVDLVRARGGYAGLSAEERTLLPEMDMSSEAHRQWFRTRIGAGHAGLTDALFERFYSIQVLWDERMADRAAVWLSGAPARRMVIFAGQGHCVNWAIPMRLARRGISEVVSVQLVGPDSGAVDEAVAGDPADFVLSIQGD
jgi:uncharacterized iron-regulated protein